MKYNILNVAFLDILDLILNTNIRYKEFIITLKL